MYLQEVNTQTDLSCSQTQPLKNSQLASDSETQSGFVTFKGRKGSTARSGGNKSHVQTRKSSPDAETSRFRTQDDLRYDLEESQGISTSSRLHFPQNDHLRLLEMLKQQVASERLEKEDLKVKLMFAQSDLIKYADLHQRSELIRSDMQKLISL